MKVTVNGSHLCPDTLYALNKLVEAKADITFQNLSASLPDLKAYLALRESSPVFEGPKAKGSLGIPCFVREDGTVTLELEQLPINPPRKRIRRERSCERKPSGLSFASDQTTFRTVQKAPKVRQPVENTFSTGWKGAAPGGAAPLCVFTGRCGTDPPGTPGGLPHRTRCRPGA